MKALKLIAGKTARQRIIEYGLSPALVRLIVGASGGPKWLVLKGLDHFLCHHFLPKATQAIDLVGSSIGAWRMSVYAHPEPGKMFDHFVDSYFSFKTTELKTSKDLTKVSYDIIHDLYPAAEAARLIINPTRNLNIVAVRGKGVSGSKNKAVEAAGILAAAGANRLSRQALKRFFDRVIFHSGSTMACPDAWDGFDLVGARLTPEILADTLMASGSIPFVSEPLFDIPGAGPGVYRDGGVIDYHFDVPWSYLDGIVLYPHFYDYIVPGWFDKSRIARRATGAVWDQMLMLAPTPEFVASLPGGKLADRTDFTAMSDIDRIAYWQVVVRESERLADEFAELLDAPGKLVDSLYGVGGNK